MTPEAKVLKKITAHLAALQQRGEPVWFLKTHGSAFQRAGVPDLLICLRGRFLGLEVKSATGEATRLQGHVMDKIVAAGGAVAVVRSVEDVKAILERMS